MWRRDVDLLAYHDLDGRSGFRLALRQAEGRFFLYVAGSGIRAGASWT
jgi:hypothetical protein